MPMRWLLLAHNLPPDPGSCSQDFGLLAEELRRQGHEVAFAGGPAAAAGAPPPGVERHPIPSWPKLAPSPWEKALQRVGEATALRRNWLAAPGIARDVRALVERLGPDVVLCNHSPALMAAVGVLPGRTAVWMKGTMNLTPGGHWRRRLSSFRRGWERRALERFGVVAFQWGPCPPREEWGERVAARGGRAVDLLPGPRPDALAMAAPRRQGEERLGIGFLGTRAPSLPGAVRLLVAGISSRPGLGARLEVHLAGPGSGGNTVIPRLLDGVEGLLWTDRLERLDGAEADGFVASHPVGLSPGNAKAPNATGT
ncbi:glycosyltransferase [bacterium]|nr:glycosyltransferase [bacterium]